MEAGRYEHTAMICSHVPTLRRLLTICLSGSALLCLLAIAQTEVIAQDSAEQQAEAPATAPPLKLTPEVIQQQLKEVDTLPNVDDATREELRGIYQEALRDLATGADYAKQAATFSEMAKNAPEKLQAVKQQMASLGTTVSIDVPSNATLAKLEELLKGEEDKLATAKRQKDRLEAEPSRRQARKAEIPGKAQKLQEARQQLKAQLATVGAGTDPRSEAQRTRLQAKLLAIDQELKLYDQELAAYTATTELLPAERDLAQRLASLAEKRVALWRESVEKRRAQEVKRQEASARMEAEVTTGVLKPLALRNSELAQRSSQLVEKIQDVNRELEQSRTLLDKTQQQFKVTKEKVDRVGLNYANGLLLRKEDASLPDISMYRRSSREREDLIRDVQLRIIDLAEERSNLTDVDYVESFVKGIVQLPRDFTREEFTDAVRKLVDKQLELLTTLQQNEDSYFDRLVDLESIQQQLIQAVEGYENYIDERVLWIRSSEMISLADFRRSAAALKWFVDRREWSGTLRALWRDFRSQILLAGLTAVLWLTLLLFQPRLRQAISKLGDRAATGSCRSFLPTLLTLAWTLLITMFWPILILMAAWRLTILPDATGFLKAVGAGLRAAGMYYAALEFLRQVCRTRGLADAHFGWAPPARIALRTNLRWMIAISTPMVFASAMLYADASSRSQDTLGISTAQESLARFFAIALMITALVFVHRTLRPEGPLFRALELSAPESTLYRLRRFVYGLILFLLGSLLILSLVGYDFTVSRLCMRSFETFVLLEVLIIAMSLVERWLLIVRRRMAIARAQQRRTQAVALAVDEQGRGTAISVEQQGPDLDKIGEQSRRLLHFLLVITALLGLWFVWIDVLPALNFFDQFELWSVTVGATTTKISVNNVVVATVIVVATVLATRNIPGLLEIFVLSRLPLDAGNRYALIMICRYVIIIVGVIVGFGSIGISWSSYQWLVAAVTVGLGFGLQEIFANFVSGLIVLFEQPIRVGDIVTIGDVTGIVSKIRMRATTVTNWERQEYIVPNREFITGRLLNWTLTNTVNRVTITVGVAYGTDPDLVRRIMLDIAQRHTMVMDDPAPIVTFESFGDSTLNILLRCYLPNLENRLATIHELNTATQRELNAVGVQFAFPTRELYIHPTNVPAEQVAELAERQAQAKNP